VTPDNQYIVIARSSYASYQISIFALDTGKELDTFSDFHQHDTRNILPLHMLATENSNYIVLALSRIIIIFDLKKRSKVRSYSLGEGKDIDDLILIIRKNINLITAS